MYPNKSNCFRIPVFIYVMTWINPGTANPTSCQDGHRNNYGRRFYVSETRYQGGHYASRQTPMPLVIRVISSEPGDVYVTAPGFNLKQKAFRISPRLTEIVLQPINNFINTTQTMMGILLESTVDAAMFKIDRINSSVYEADGMMMLPEDVLGRSYVIPSFWSGSGEPRIKVIGTQDNTRVNITFMSTIETLFEWVTFSKNMQKTYSLNFLEVLELYISSGDPAGTIVESNKPVAVMFEEPGAIIKPNSSAGGTFDKISTQPLPVHQWGDVYVVPPVYPRDKYLVRVFAYFDGTTITFESTSTNWTIVLNKGDFKQYEFETDPLVAKGNKPFSVYQFSFSSDYVSGGQSSMVLIPSLEKFSRGPYTLPTEKSEHFFDPIINYVSIVIEKQYTQQLFYNGNALTPSIYAVPSLSDYDVLVFQLNSSAHEHIISNGDPAANFGLVVNGISRSVQYGFVAGMEFIHTACHPFPTVSTMRTTTTAVKSTIPVNGLRCYSCAHIPHLRYCDTLQQCQNGQVFDQGNVVSELQISEECEHRTTVCFSERHLSSSGIPYFSAGCTDEQACPFKYPSATAASDSCLSCCRSDFCNYVGCQDQGLPALGQRGPLCFDCQNFDNPIACDRVTLCADDEVCSIEEYRWGSTEKIYKMGCSVKNSCTFISDNFRRNVPICHSCCNQDYCNSKCTNSPGVSSIVG